MPLGSGLVDHNQWHRVAAIEMTDMNVWAHRSYRRATLTVAICKSKAMACSAETNPLALPGGKLSLVGLGSFAS